MLRLFIRRTLSQKRSHMARVVEGSHSFTCHLHEPHLPLLSLVLIYWPRRDGRLSLPGCLLSTTTTIGLPLYVYTEMLEMRQWSKPTSRRSSANKPQCSAPCRSGHAAVAAVGDNWPLTSGLSAVIKDTRLHETLQSMYMPPSQLRIGSTIGRGLCHHPIPSSTLASVAGRVG